MGKITISMVIFHSYVKLPEGNLWLFLVSSVKCCNPIIATWMPHVLSFHVEKGILLRISLARSVISSRAVRILDGYGSNHCLSPPSFMLSNMSLPTHGPKFWVPWTLKNLKHGSLIVSSQLADLRVARPLKSCGPWCLPFYRSLRRRSDGGTGVTGVGFQDGKLPFNRIFLLSGLHPTLVLKNLRQTLPKWVRTLVNGPQNGITSWSCQRCWFSIPTWGPLIPNYGHIRILHLSGILQDDRH